jgi:hypothetical protein
MKYIAPEMEMELLYAEDIMASGENEGGNEGGGNNKGEFDEEEI